jgi:hypothetical protein
MPHHSMIQKNDRWSLRFGRIVLLSRIILEVGNDTREYQLIPELISRFPPVTFHISFVFQGWLAASLSFGQGETR